MSAINVNTICKMFFQDVVVCYSISHHRRHHHHYSSELYRWYLSLLTNLTFSFKTPLSFICISNHVNINFANFTLALIQNGFMCEHSLLLFLLRCIDRNNFYETRLLKCTFIAIGKYFKSSNEIIRCHFIPFVPFGIVYIFCVCVWNGWHFLLLRFCLASIRDHTVENK